MGKLKQAYMAATMDDQGEAPDWFRKEGLLSNFTDDELRAELNRRWNEDIEQIFKPVLEDLNKIIERLNDGGK